MEQRSGNAQAVLRGDSSENLLRNPTAFTAYVKAREKAARLPP